MPTRKDAPPLEGWINLADLADLLGVTKQRVHKLADSGRIETLHKLGRRPDYVLREDEVPAIRDRIGRRRAPDPVPDDAPAPA